MKKRMLILGVIFSMSAVSIYGCGTQSTTAAETETETEKATEAADLLDDTAESLLNIGHSDTSGKEDTVYVISDANGNVKEKIVSTWLKNANGDSTVNDVTNLSDIENVKGNETYTDNGDGTITWDANGNDIYYQGKSNSQLPVDVGITYTLDGKSVTAEELNGASGHLEISFKYTNNTGTKKTIDGKDATIYRPYLMISGMLMDNEKAANINVTNGKVINDGNKSVVVGMAVPGLKESLGLDDVEDKDGKLIDLDVPEDVTIEADVTDFSLLTTLTVATDDALKQFGLDDTDTDGSIQDLKDSSKELTDSSQKLIDGATDLNDGISDLSEGTNKLDTGVNDLNDGAQKLDEGAGTLKDGVDTLATGATTLDEGATKLNDGAASAKTGSKTLKDGISTYTGGVKTLNDSMPTLLAGMSALSDGAKNLNTGAASISKGVDNYVDVVDQLAAGAKQLSGLQNLDQVYNAALTLKTVVVNGTDGTDSLAVGTQSVATGAKQINDSVSGMKEELGSLKAAIDGTKSVTTNVETATVGANAWISTVLNVLNPLPASLTSAATTIDGANNTISAANTKIDTANNAIDTANGVIKDANTKISEADAKIAGINSAVDSINVAAEQTIQAKTNVQTAQLNVSQAIDSGSVAIQVAIEAATSAGVDDATIQDLKNAKDTLESQKQYLNNALTDPQTADKLDSINAEQIPNIEDGINKADAIDTSSLDLEKIKTAIGTLNAAENGTSETPGLTTIGTGLSKSALPTIQTITDGLAGVDSSQIDALIKGTKELSDGAAKVSAGVNGTDTTVGLVQGLTALESSTQSFPAAAAGMKQLLEGFDKLTANDNALKSGASQVADGAYEVSSGAATLYAGGYKAAKGVTKLNDSSKALNKGASDLSAGLSTLKDGTSNLKTGTTTLTTGTAKLKDGASDLKDGTAKLAEGTETMDDNMVDLLDGVSQLLDGSGEMKDGVVKFDEEGIQKIADLIDEDVNGFYDRLKAIQDYSDEEVSFTGDDANTETSVKYIYKTDSIGEE